MSDGLLPLQLDRAIPYWLGILEGKVSKKTVTSFDAALRNGIADAKECKREGQLCFTYSDNSLGMYKDRFAKHIGGEYVLNIIKGMHASEQNAICSILGKVGQPVKINTYLKEEEGWNSCEELANTIFHCVANCNSCFDLDAELKIHRKLLASEIICVTALE